MTKTIRPLLSHYSSTKWEREEERFFEGKASVLISNDRRGAYSNVDAKSSIYCTLTSLSRTGEFRGFGGLVVNFIKLVENDKMAIYSGGTSLQTGRGFCAF